MDTAILICGVLTCCQDFLHPEIRDLAYRSSTGSTGLALGRYIIAAARMDAGERLPALSLGLVQRAHDDVPAGTGLLLASASGRSLARMEADHFRIRRDRYIGSFAPLFVHQYSQAWFDFRGKRDQYANYFQNSEHRHRSAPAVLPGISRAIPGLQRRSLGHHRVRFRERIRGVGRAAGNRTDRRHGGSERGGGLAAVSSAAVMRVLRTVRTVTGNSLEPLRIRRRIQSADPLVRHGRGRHRYRDHHVDGRKRAHRLVWNTFMKNPEAQRGMRRAGFRAEAPPTGPIAT